MQHEAIADNPIRHLGPIERGSRRPRALTTVERRHFLGWMAGRSDREEEARAQTRARRRDLPDIVTFMIGTGHDGKTETSLRIVPPQFVVATLRYRVVHGPEVLPFRRPRQREASQISRLSFSSLFDGAGVSGPLPAT